MNYSEDFKTAVREDILRRIDEDENFAKDFDDISNSLDADTIRNIAYEKYAQKPEFKKYLDDRSWFAKFGSDAPYILGVPLLATILILYIAFRRNRVVLEMGKTILAFPKRIYNYAKTLRAYRKISIIIAILLLIFSYLYINRWEYKVTGSTIVRINKYTGGIQVFYNYEWITAQKEENNKKKN